MNSDMHKKLPILAHMDPDTHKKSRFLCTVSSNCSRTNVFDQHPGRTGYSLHMERIVIDPAVCNGRPIIKGTRIAVQTILEALGAGDSIDEVLAAYPAVQHADILAAFQYSSRLLANHYKVTLVA